MNQTKNEYRELVERLTRYLESKGISQTVAAKGIGVSSTLLNQVLKNKYTGNMEVAAGKIRSYLDLQEERSSVVLSELPFVETEQVKQIRAILNVANKHRMMGLISGNSGVGKTRTLKQYCEEKVNARYVSACIAITPMLFFDKLCDEVGAKKGGNHDRLIQSAIDSLKGSNLFIVIDEAQHLTYKIIEQIRHLHDESGVGVVLVGTFEMMSNIVSGEENKYAQIYSRTPLKKRLSKGFTPGDIENILKKCKINLEARSRKTLLRLANKNGHLRFVKSLLVLASDIAAQDKKEVNSEHIEAAESMLVMGA